MTAPELLDLAARHGITARLDGDAVKLRPADRVTPELLETLRQHKAEIREHLRRQPSGVGPWEPPGAVHPPRQCVRCAGGLQPSDPDGGPCGSCTHYFSLIEPRRPQ